MGDALWPLMSLLASFPDGRVCWFECVKWTGTVLENVPLRLASHPRDSVASPALGRGAGNRGKAGFSKEMHQGAGPESRTRLPGASGRPAQGGPGPSLPHSPGRSLCPEPPWLLSAEALPDTPGKTGCSLLQPKWPSLGVSPASLHSSSPALASHPECLVSYLSPWLDRGHCEGRSQTCMSLSLCPKASKERCP